MPPARAEPGRRSATPGQLLLEGRILGGDAQPLAVHLHPGIGEPHLFVERLTGRILSLAGEHAGGDGRVAEYGDLEIRIVDAAPGIRFRVGEHGVLATEYLAVSGRLHDLVGQQWREQLRVVRLLRLEPLLRKTVVY